MPPQELLVEWITRIAYCVSEASIAYGSSGTAVVVAKNTTSIALTLPMVSSLALWLLGTLVHMTLLQQCFSNLRNYPSLEDLVKCRFRFSRSEVEPKVSMSNKTPGWGWYCYTSSYCKRVIRPCRSKDWGFSWPSPKSLCNSLFTQLSYLWNTRAAQKVIQPCNYSCCSDNGWIFPRQPRYAL